MIMGSMSNAEATMQPKSNSKAGLEPVMNKGGLNQSNSGNWPVLKSPGR